MDNIPTRVVFNNTHAKLARQYWVFHFQQVLDLPEALVAGMEEIFLRHFCLSWTYDSTANTDADPAEYVRANSQPGAFRGAFSHYRAGPQDLAQNIGDADAPEDHPDPCPH